LYFGLRIGQIWVNIMTVWRTMEMPGDASRRAPFRVEGD
jgi:hypothetical protein